MPFTPHDAGVHAIKRARELLQRARSGPRGETTFRADLRRLSVVMAVAALDTYMHRLIVQRAFSHEALPPALGRLDVPFERLLAQADEAGAAARREPKHTRPRVTVKRQLRERLLRETFQRSKDVSAALAMAGYAGRWDEIGKAFDPPRPPVGIKAQLDAIVRRRNQIVHEGDYKRLERPRNPGRNALGQRDARLDIDFLADLIDAIHTVVSR